MNTKRKQRLQKKATDFFYDHYILGKVLHETGGVFIGVLAAFIFAVGFTSFITPYKDTVPFLKIITGGVSGLSQNVALFLKLLQVKVTDTTIEAIGYSCFNIPLLIFAFFAIGKRFAIQTTINVIATSIFINFIPEWGLSGALASSPILSTNGLIFRIIFAGICTGVSSSLAFKGEFSCGGIDIVTYYFSLRKSTSVGKYSLLINFFIILLYSVLMIIDNNEQWADALLSCLVSVIYLFIVATVIDRINLRNKKLQIEIITNSENMAPILVANFPHGATIVNGKGAYSRKDRTIIYIIVTSSEAKKVINLARKVDEHSFITVTSLVQVYGNFFIRPIE